MALPTKLSLNSIVARSVTDKLTRYSRRPSQSTIPSVATTTTTASSSSSSSADQLSQQECAVVMQHMSLVLMHLRARIRCELGPEGGAVFTSALPHSAYVDDARIVASMGTEEELLYLLEHSSLDMLAGVVKLAFHVHSEPLLEAAVCAQLFKLLTSAASSSSSSATMDADDVRSVLVGLPGSKIDLLGQLLAILAVDRTTSVNKLAYAFGPAVFLPKFGVGQKDAEVERYKQHGFDAMAWPQMAVTVTQYMIENADDVFGLDDDDTIDRLAHRLEERRRRPAGSSCASLSASASSEVVEVAEMASDDSTTTTVDEALLSTSSFSFQLPTPPAPPPAAAAAVVVPAAACRANFSFKAKNPWELTVARGEHLQVLERGKDAWWEVRAEDGRVGLVPEAFVQQQQQPQDSADDIEAEIQATLRDMQRLLRVKDRKRRRKQQQEEENAAPPSNNTPQPTIKPAAAAIAHRHHQEAVD